MTRDRMPLKDSAKRTICPEALPVSPNLFYFILCLKISIRILSQGPVQANLPEWGRDAVETSRNHGNLKLQQFLTEKTPCSASSLSKSYCQRPTTQRGNKQPQRAVWLAGDPLTDAVLKECKLT